MSNNPYQVSAELEDPVIGVLGGRPEDLLDVARYQRWIIRFSLLYLGTTAFAIGLGIYAELTDRDFGALVVPIFGLMFGALGLAVFSVFRLSAKVYPSTAVGLLLGGLVLIPCLGLVMLLCINGKATRLLRQNGIRVGFLGVRPDTVRPASSANDPHA